MGKKIDEIDFEILWEGVPSGLWDRFLTLIHLNFTKYQITADELIIMTGFFKRRSNSFELYTLKDPDMTETLLERMIGVGTVSITVDTHSSSERAGMKIYLRHLKDAAKVRKLLRDAIEDDVNERKITYFDKV
ncbi:MAG: PH domain-containing protein [Bacilli bacterium]|nr:PH domain-containing protein [Bacilli bacterium]